MYKLEFERELVLEHGELASHNGSCDDLENVHERPPGKEERRCIRYCTWVYWRRGRCEVPYDEPDPAHQDIPPAASFKVYRAVLGEGFVEDILETVSALRTRFQS